MPARPRPNNQDEAFDNIEAINREIHEIRNHINRLSMRWAMIIHYTEQGMTMDQAINMIKITSDHTKQKLLEGILMLQNGATIQEVLEQIENVHA